MEVQKFEAKPLPSLAELHHNVEEAFKNDELNALLNQPVHSSWVS